jgi:phage terminase large subunit
MNDIKIQTTRIFELLVNTDKRFVLSVGSSRSSKTYSMLQWIIYYCLQNKDKGKYISVVRGSFPSLRRTVYREFVEILTKHELYEVNKHNKTEHKINVFGNWVEFFSLNDSQKIRGAKRDILYLNEANEIDYESAEQLFMRTNERIFMDENPSDVWHWSMKYQNRDDCDYIHSTYKDNPFISPHIVAQLESYKDKDENLYRVYTLGLPGYSITTIYTHYKFYDDEDLYLENETPLYDDYSYGLDVGYGHAMALTKCYFKGDTVWVEELIYQSALTSADLIELMKSININENKVIWVDSAAPAMIEDLKRAGFNAKSADKSVKEGIDYIKSLNLFIENDSINLIDELKRYSWKTKGEQIIYEPVKVADDLCDSMRYCIWNEIRRGGVSDWNLLF